MLSSVNNQIKMYMEDSEKYFRSTESNMCLLRSVTFKNKYCYLGRLNALGGGKVHFLNLINILYHSKTLKVHVWKIHIYFQSPLYFENL